MNVMNGICVAGVGLLVLVMLLQIAPGTGAAIESSSAAKPGSAWNTTENTCVPNAAESWGWGVSLVVLSFIIGIFVIVIVAARKFQ